MNNSPPPSSNDKENNTDTSEKLSVLHILTSVLAGAIGVQSKKNQQKDFSNKNSIYIYIAAGIIFTALFVITVYAVVKMVLNNAGM